MRKDDLFQNRRHSPNIGSPGHIDWKTKNDSLLTYTEAYIMLEFDLNNFRKAKEIIERLRKGKSNNYYIFSCTGIAERLQSKKYKKNENN